MNTVATSPRGAPGIAGARELLEDFLASGRAACVLPGDAYDLFDALPAETVDLIITSPPYWGHREYAIGHAWDFFNDIAKARRIGPESQGYDRYRSNGGVLGLEPYPEWYVEHVTEIFARAQRCLKPGGSLWLNVGDTYFARWSSIRERGRQGLGDTNRLRRKTPMGGLRQEKQLLLLPARVAIGLQGTGWILRNDLIWFKPNATPRPERDRLKQSHEHFFHFVKKPKLGRPKYHYDREQTEPLSHDVVTVAARPGEEGHTATFPTQLIVPRILSSCPKGGLVLDPFCGTGRALVVACENGRRALGFDVQGRFVKACTEKLRRLAPTP